MPLIKSLFCWTGADNRIRYISLISLSHLFFILFTAIFASSFFIGFITLLLSTTIIICTTRRRLIDGELSKNWLYFPAIFFAIIGLLIITLGHQSLYWLTLLSIAVSWILLTYSSKNNRNYLYGYCGPINLRSESNNNQKTQRIEPTLSNSQHTVNSEKQPNTFYENRSSAPNEFGPKNSRDIGELIREKILQSKNSKYTVIGFVCLIIITVIISLLVPNNEAIDAQVELQQDTTLTISDFIRENKITLPDEFSLMTTQYKGLIIQWQADENTQKTLWNIRQTVGDSSCKSILFNNNKSYRTTLVAVENGQDYFAEFSPLDTKNLLISIAGRSSFTLCGYSFSLKGSQAALGKHSFYAEQIN